MQEQLARQLVFTRLVCQAFEISQAFAVEASASVVAPDPLHHPQRLVPLLLPAFKQGMDAGHAQQQPRRGTLPDEKFELVTAEAVGVHAAQQFIQGQLAGGGVQGQQFQRAWRGRAQDDSPKDLFIGVAQGPRQVVPKHFRVQLVCCTNHQGAGNRQGAIRDLHVHAFQTPAVRCHSINMVRSPRSCGDSMPGLELRQRSMISCSCLRCTSSTMMVQCAENLERSSGTAG